MIDNNDQQLIGQFADGDENSFNLLVSKYFRRVFSFVYIFVNDRKEAEDLAQETFVKVWRGLKKFDRTKNFRTWLLAIAKNCAIDYLRKKKHLTFSEMERDEGFNLSDSLTDDSPLPSEQMEQFIASTQLNESLDKLPLKQRSVLSLYYQSDLNFREIAEIMDEPINTVKSRHRRALAVLKQSLS